MALYSILTWIIPILVGPIKVLCVALFGSFGDILGGMGVDPSLAYILLETYGVYKATDLIFPLIEFALSMGGD